jgi:hypothetical protein
MICGLPSRELCCRWRVGCKSCSSSGVFDEYLLIYDSDEHPGGPQALFSHMGKDATEEFEMLHDDEVIPKYAPEIVIGRVKGQEVTLEY